MQENLKFVSSTEALHSSASALLKKHAYLFLAQRQRNEPVKVACCAHPLGMEVLHGLADRVEDRTGLPFRETLLLEDPVQQFSSSH